MTPFNKHDHLVAHLHAEVALERADSARHDADETTAVDVRQLGRDYCELESMARAYVDHIGALNKIVTDLRDKLGREQFVSACAAEIIADLKAQLAAVVDDEDDERGDREEVEALGAAVIQ